jgi:hypothetical protein
MSKKVWAILFLIFLVMFGLNYLMPLCYGDDYVYAFIWPGQSMYIPLPETVERISGLYDILVSQWKHYLTWGGRVPAHMLVQFFVWQNKLLFDILNSVVFVLLVLEIYWIANKGEVTLKNINLTALCVIFFSVWAFTVNFAGVFLWISGACNYLWMLAILLSFLILYVHKYYSMNKMTIRPGWVKYLIFVWGILAGWTNENAVCWIILALGLWIFKNRKQEGMETWMWFGLFGLCAGYFLLLLAPGNAVRADSYATVSIWSWSHIRFNLITFGVIEFFQVFLWFFIIVSWRKIRSTQITEEGLRHLLLVKSFCALNLLSSGIMLLTPEFPARSGFSGLVFLTIGVALLICNQADLNVSLVENGAKKFIWIVAGGCFLITLYGTYAGLYSTYRYNQSVVLAVRQHKKAGLASVLEIPAPPKYSETLVWMSGRHIVHLSLKEDERDWTNVAFARYYGIKGVRIINLERDGL